MTSALSNIYGRQAVSFTHGQGVWLWDAQGRRYLDALSGIGVTCLGHAHPTLVKAICDQASKVIHTSNIYEIEHQEKLAQELVRLSGMTEVFFANSGSEANEGAIKLARMYGHKRGIKVPTIISMESSWHGRTLGTLAATGSTKAREGFDPLPEGFMQVRYNDIAALEAAGDQCPDVVAVLLEVVQGEGGIRPTEASYLKAVRDLCTARGWLLMIDEVQAGMGRTGKWFSYEWAGIQPDVVTLAKGLGGGVPIGAVIATGPAAGVLQPGQHGTTFGGGPLVCAAGLAVLETIESDKILDNVNQVGAHLVKRLQDGLAGLDGVREIRGKGLMLGIELDRPCAILVPQALEQGLLINVTRDSVVRLLPPLILSMEEADTLADTLISLIQQFLQDKG
ncbi:acetylornithine transaminase [Orrella sp. 11846]|uniref:acetylornithine transaminase n=1 Tax=Orrella sp. 11846 TaxID=3409913 RepID=UPI003B5C4A92